MTGQHFLVISAIFMLIMPRKYTPLLFLFCGLLIPRGAFIELGSLHLFPSRVLIMAGFVRMILRREFPTSFPVREDWWLLGFALICLTTSFFHKDPYDAFIFRGSLALDSVGTYFLFRAWIREWADIIYLIKGSTVLLVVLAVTMIYEKFTDKNLFVYLGQTLEYSKIREGKIRAQGPFTHSIIAGTIGAVFLPLSIALWRDNRAIAVTMLISSVIVAYASASSGPLLTLIAGLLALYLWKYRLNLRTIRWLAIGTLLLLELIMQDHVWFLIARIDLVGGSTGWHRAKLISQSLYYLDEWWLAGTDFTRHWMPTGVSWSPEHTDITNYYIKMGVIGGLPLMLCFIKVLTNSFKNIGETFRESSKNSGTINFQVWCLGASLFAHCVSFVGVSYFDQSIVSLYSLIGIIVSGCITFNVKPWKSRHI